MDKSKAQTRKHAGKENRVTFVLSFCRCNRAEASSLFLQIWACGLGLEADVECCGHDPRVDVHCYHILQHSGKG